MSALETFFIAFESDSKDVEKGAQQAKKATNELEGGILDTKGAADALGQSFVGAVISAQKSITALLSIGALTAKAFSEASQSEALGRFTERLDQNIEQVDAWSRAIQQTGGSADTFRGTLEGLVNTLTEFSITGGGAAAETFARLGISAFDAGGRIKSAFELLPEIADSFEHLSQKESANLGQKLGLDNATILLLQRGRSAIDDLTRRQRDLGVVTKEDTEIATLYNIAWRDTQTLFASVARSVGSVFLPILTELQTKFQDLVIYLRNNEEFLKEIFIAAAGIITAVYLPAMTKAAIATTLAIAPFIAIGAAVAALALIINDFNNYLEGNDSLIGRISEKWPRVGEIVKSMAKAFQNLKDILSEVLESMKDLFSGNIGKTFDRAARFLGLAPEAEAPPEYENVGGGHTRADLPPGLDPDLSNAASEAITTAQNNPLSGANSQSISNESRSLNQQSVVNVAAVNVDARGGDSEEIASNMREALTEEIEQTMSQNSTAVMI